MRLSSVPDWVHERMNQGSPHKIKNTKSSYAMVMDGDYQINQIREDDKKNGKYIYTVVCENDNTIKMVEFFKWMLYIAKDKNRIVLRFLYNSNLSYHDNEEYEMILTECEKNSDNSFSLTLFTDRSLNSTDSDIIDVDCKEETVEEENQRDYAKEMEEVCKNLQSIVKEQREVIDELVHLKSEVETIKTIMNNMIPKDDIID